MAQSLEVQALIGQLRMKCLDGTITQEELKEGVKLMRAGRMNSSVSAETKRRTKAIAEIPKASDLLNELDNL